MFRTQSSEMRNSSASSFAPSELRGSSLLNLSLSPFFTRRRRHGETHLRGATRRGTCSAMDQSLNVGISAIARRDYERNAESAGSMLVANEDIVNCVQEHVVVKCI